MGNFIAQLQSCGGFIDVLLGAPDYEIDARGIRHSAAYRARAQSEIENETRDWILKTERECADRDKELSSLTNEAVRCNKLSKAMGVTSVQKQAALDRARKALVRIKVLQSELHTERVHIQQARDMLDRVGAVQKTDEKRKIFSKLAHLQNETVGDVDIDSFQKAGEDAIQSHAELGEFVHAVQSTTVDMERAQTADSNSLAMSYEVRDDKQLQAELDALEQQAEPMITVAPRRTLASTERDLDELLLTPEPPVYVPHATTAPIARVPTALAYGTDGRARERQRRNVNDDDDDLYSAL